MKFKVIIALLVMISLASASMVVCDDYIKMYLKADDTTAFSLEDACLATGNNSAERGNATFGQPMEGTGSILYAAEEDARITNTTVLEGYSALTIDFHLNITDNSSQQFVASTGSNNFFIYWDGVGETFTSHLAIGGTDEAITINDHITENTEAHYAIQYNYTHLSAWKEIDGVMIEIATPEPAIGVTNQTTPHEVFCLGSYTTDFNVCNSRGLVGTLDEFIVSTVTRYGNNATAFTPVTPAVTSITVTSITPTDNEVNNTVPVYFNYSYTPALVDEYITNVTFHTNGTKELTNTSVIPDANISYFSKTFTGSTEEVVTWLVSVETNTTSYNSSLRTFYWDEVAPIITHSFPLNSTAVIQEGNVTIVGTITDNNLHNVNITLYNSSGTAIWNYTTFGATSPFSYNQNIPLHTNSSGGTGTYDLVIEAADDHNKVSKKSKVQPKASSLTKDLANNKFTFKNNVWDVTYTLTSKQKIKNVTTEFKDQKQSFRLETKETGNEIKTYVIKVEGEGLVPINSKHLGHILKPNEYYLDFDGVKGTTKVKCYPTYCDVEIKTKQNTLDIKSIGGVNFIEEDVQFSVNNDPSYTYVQTENTQTVIQKDKDFFLNLTVNNLLVADVYNTRLHLNNTNYTVSLTNTSSLYQFTTTQNINNITGNAEYLRFNWTSTIKHVNGTVVNITTTTYLLTIVKAQMTACGDITNTTALTILLRDEITNKYVNGSLKATFTMYGSHDSLNQTLSINGSGKYNYSFCIFPSWADVRIDSFEEYYNQSYGTRHYFLDYLNVTNTTRIVNHYFLNDSNSESVSITLYDKTLEPVEAALVYFYRYYPAENVYRNTAMIKTGEGGEGTAILASNIVYYRISVYKDRKIVETFTPQVISCTTTFCTLDLSITPNIEGEFWEIYDNYIATCSNTTSTLTCTIQDNTFNLKSARLTMFKNTKTGPQIICLTNATVSGKIATVSCPIPTGNGTFYYLLEGHFDEYFSVLDGYILREGPGILIDVGIPITFFLLLTLIWITKSPSLTILFTGITLGMTEILTLTSFGLMVVGPVIASGIVLVYLIEWRQS